VQAPTGGSIHFAAVLLKLGAYGYIRFCMGLLVAWPGLLRPRCRRGHRRRHRVRGAVAWKQDDVKRLVAYSSVAHMGFVMLGLFAGTQAGMEGAVLQMLNHASRRRAVPFGRRDLRPPAHRLDPRIWWHRQGDPIYAALFVNRHHVEHRRARHQRLRREFMVVMGTSCRRPSAAKPSCKRAWLRRV